MFSLFISCLDHFQFALIHGPNIPGSYTILLFTASDFTSITSHIHNWVLFLLWLCPFILFGVISPLISSSIFGTYQPGEFIFQCPIFFVFSYCSWGSQGKNTEVVCHSLLQWTMFCSELYAMTCPSWVVLHSMAYSFIELDKAVMYNFSQISICPFATKLFSWYCLVAFTQN